MKAPLIAIKQIFGRWSAGRLIRLCALALCLFPITTDLTHFSIFTSMRIRREFSAGKASVPLEEIYYGHSASSEAEVVRHALRIVEQHYVQREKLNLVRMLGSAVSALSREHGGDIELGFLGQNEQDSMRPAAQRTTLLCTNHESDGVRFCDSTPVLNAADVQAGASNVDVLIRVGLRVFVLNLSGENSLRVLDLVGRFIVPEYAKFRRVSVGRAVHTYLNGLLDQVDPHSSYMTQDEYRELRSGTRGQFGGVGLVVDELQELPVIREVVPNSPAHMAGVRPGDVLLKVGNTISAFFPLDSVVRSIRELSSDAATPIWFFRPMSRRVFRAFLAREEIPTRSAEVRTVAGRPDVLHIRVTGFSNHTAEDVFALYEQAQLSARGQLKLFVLDLRGNPGGLLDQAIQLSDLFIRTGQIVSTRSRFEEQIEQATRGSKIDLPVVVLMNSSSASASEIVAGALKDHGRALLVGERTFGKGSVQSLFELSTGTALKLTVAHYFTPMGRSLQGIGVEPHVNVKLVQPRDGYVWMSGSSELDREEHLAAHLMNPSRRKGSVPNPMSVHLWALSPPEANSIAALRPINFSYPIGDNTQTLVRLEDDAVARVGIEMASRLFRGRKLFSPFHEKELREAHRIVAGREIQTFKNTIGSSVEDAQARADWNAFLDSGNFDDAGIQSAGHKVPLVTMDEGFDGNFASGSAQRGGVLKEIFWQIWGGRHDAVTDKTGPSPRGLSLSAKSMFAWQSDARLLLSLNTLKLDGVTRSGLASGLLGLRLDDLHDGPTVWLPARFTKTEEGRLVSTVELPKAIRTYLSSLGGSTGSTLPSVVGHVKFRLGDRGEALGMIRFPRIAARDGVISGRLMTRGGQTFLQVSYKRSVGDQLGLAAVNTRAWDSGLEALIAPLSDERLSVPSTVIPLQRVSATEYVGECELLLQSVRTRGLEFAGLVGAIVRGRAGDVLATAPLLVVGEEGVYPIRKSDDMR